MTSCPPREGGDPAAGDTTSITELTGVAQIQTTLNGGTMKHFAAVYAKFIVALSAALGVAVSVTVDGAVSLNDGFAIAAAGVGALAVAAVPNQPQP